MKKTIPCSVLSTALLGLLGLPNSTFAASQFQFTQYGDVLAGFRQPGVGSYELVVNLGNITNFVALAPGATLNMSAFTPAQLSDAFPGGYGSLNWSVSSGFLGTFGTWAGYQAPTIWYTLPRSDSNTQTPAPSRASVSTQSVNRQNMLGAGDGAVTISGSLGASNQDNTVSAVREPVWDGVSQVRNDFSYFVDNDANGGPVGTFGLPNVVENTTPASFTSPVRSDLYQSVPTGYTDPQSGTNNGAAYYVGYFQLDPDGTMSFTRASTSVPLPPPPQLVSITRAAGTSTVYFTTTNNATYTLYYTNSGGLSQPVTSWPSSATTLIGDGLTDHLTDVTSDTNRFYRIGVR